MNTTPTRFSAIAVELWCIQRRMVLGCGNHGCRVKEPLGIGCNGACHCDARHFARDLRDLAERLEREYQLNREVKS
jgi:hypothetical protein